MQNSSGVAEMWDDVPLLQSYGRRVPSGGQIAEKGRRVEDHAKWTTKTTNIVDEKVDMFAIGVLVLEVITSRRAVDTTEAMHVGIGCECVLFSGSHSPLIPQRTHLPRATPNGVSRNNQIKLNVSLFDRLFDIGRFLRSAAVDLVPMKNTEESESSGSRAVVASPSQENPRHYRMKLDVLGEVLQRLQESSYEEAALPDFEDRLWQHFNRLPARYALDVNVERAEDVLTHLRLLKLAEDPATRPAFVMYRVVLSTPTFGSSPNFEPITPGSKLVDSAVNATLATRELGLNIQEAHAFSTADGFSLNVFVVAGWSQEETDGLKDALGNEILKLKKLITKTQQTFDRALSTLPVTQHGMIWESYLVFVSQEGVPVETSLSVYRRYEDYIKLLLKSGRGLEAAENLIDVLSRVGEVGNRGTFNLCAE
ncbi:unnamed protein product [Brassica napus]|nr:unnamed protein product [Brassica napus]